MAKPKIRHIALFARDPEKLAKFYVEVFDMELVHTNGRSYYVSDGYLMLAILKQRLEGGAMKGLNHFGFTLDDRAEVTKRLLAHGVEDPKARPSDRPYAEFRAVDPEGNWFDLSEGGVKDKAAIAARKKQLEAAK